MRYAPCQPMRSFSRNTHWILLIVILVAVAAVYASTLRFGFVYDDVYQILENPHIQSHHFEAQFFTGQVWQFMYANWAGVYYRPLFLLWLQVNWLLFGASPVGWHALAVVVHSLATFLVYRVCRRILGSPPAALVAAAVFGLHPIHVEAVAWLSAVPEALGAVLILAAFLCYLRGRRAGMLWTVVSLLLFALAALVKETALVFPFLLIAYEWLLGSEPVKDAPKPALRALAASAPYLAVAAAYLLARMIALRGFAHPELHWSARQLLFTLPSVLWFYIRMSVLPVGLSTFYDLDFLDAPGFFTFFVPLLQVIAACALLFVWSRRSRVAAFLTLWFALTLAPAVAGLYVFHPHDIVHDRYLYLPSVAVAALAGLVFERASSTSRRTWVVAGLSIVLVAEAVGTFLQSRYWLNNLTLFSRAVHVAPRDPDPRVYLAQELQKRGLTPAALQLYQQALDLDPASWRANFGLGTFYYDQGRFADAQRLLTRATEVFPSNAVVRNAAHFYYLGLSQLRLGDPAGAERNLRQASEIHPDVAGYRLALGTALEQQQKWQEARQAYEAELRIDPASQAARQRLAQLQPHLR